MTETALAPIIVTDDQLALVKRTVAQGASDEELRLFLFDCQRQGVHPLDRMLHFTKRGGRYTPITSIDLMRTRAAETGECAGIDDAVFPPDDDGLPKWARVTVYRLTGGQKYAYTATARWGEYYPGDQQGHMWRKMPHTMLGKCAEALALRKAFPKQLSGLYAREEMDQADREVAARPRNGRAEVVEAKPVDSEAEAKRLFPTPEEDEHRTALIHEAAVLGQKLKLTAVDKRGFAAEFLGGRTVEMADIEQVEAMVAELRKRAGAAA